MKHVSINTNDSRDSKLEEAIAKEAEELAGDLKKKKVEKEDDQFQTE